MDPLSLTASIIAVVGAASQTSKALRALSNLRNAPKQFLEFENEVSDLQALLCLFQKATRNLPQSTISPEDQESIRLVIQSAEEPLKELERLVMACLRDPDTTTANKTTLPNISRITWVFSKHSVMKIKKKLDRAYLIIHMALSSLNAIHQQEANRLILNIRELVLHQTKMTDEETCTKVTDEDVWTEDGELPSCCKFGYGINEQMKENASDQEPTLVAYQTLSIAPFSHGNMDLSLAAKAGETTWQVSEKETPIFDDRSRIQDAMETSASIHTSISKGTCDWRCGCQCHPRKNRESPRWLTELLGTLFYSHTGTPLLRLHRCNFSGCVQREAASCHVTYHFPRWMMKRAFTLSASYRDLVGLSASWSIGFPRTISASHNAWQCIERYQPQEFLQLLRKELISSNDMADDDGTSLLLYALKFRSHDIVGLLLDYGANPHLVDPRGISAHAYAQSSLLIDRPTQRPNWSLKMDITIGQPSVTDEICFSPLHYVVIGLEQADLPQQLRLNRDYIDKPDAFGRSLLHWAVIMGNSTAVKVLIEHGVNPTAVDKEHMTPLHNIYLAPSSSQVQCAQLLLDAGAEVDALDVWDRTPFRIAVGYDSINLGLIQLLINNGAHVNCRDINSQTPLLKAVNGSKKTIEMLLTYGADTEARDEYGNTPVLEAIYRNKPEILRMLLEHGPTIDERFVLKPGRCARDGLVHLLNYIVWYGSVEVMETIERAANYLPHLIGPTDSLEAMQQFRQANGRKAGEKERRAFERMLSKMKLRGHTSLHPYLSGVDGDVDSEGYEEIFFDA